MVYFVRMKKINVAYYILAVFLIGLISVIYFSRQESAPTTPKLKLAYYESSSQLAQAIIAQVVQDQPLQNYYWIGVEPGKKNHLELAQFLKESLEKEKSFDLVLLDQELQLTPAEQSLFKVNQFILVKENWDKLARIITENKNKKILVITASIYSTNLLAKNPLDKVSQASQITPLTLSMAYFPAFSEEEKNSLFQCYTDDKEGVSEWGCATMNKARHQRRKVDIKKIQENSQIMTSTMDLTGPQDYMVLVR